MRFSQCIHGEYDHEMKAVYQKYSQNNLLIEDSESTLKKRGYPLFIRISSLLLLSLYLKLNHTVKSTNDSTYSEQVTNFTIYSNIFLAKKPYHRHLSSEHQSQAFQ